MKTILPLIIAFLFAFTGTSPGQVHSGAKLPEPGDKVGTEISNLLSNTENASNHFRDMDADEISKSCALGIRISHKPAFANPRTLVILIDIKRKDLMMVAGPNSLAWVEYFYTDYTTLSLHRTVKAIPLRNLQETKNLILNTPLWDHLNQNDIPGFKDNILDGGNYQVDLIHGNKTKSLNYHAPSSYNDTHHNRFRDNLYLLLQSLDQAGAPFHLCSPETRKRIKTNQDE